MANTRSRLHALLQSCCRCLQSPVVHATILDRQLHTARKILPLLSHRRLWTRGEQTLQSCHHQHHHPHHYHHHHHYHINHCHYRHHHHRHYHHSTWQGRELSVAAPQRALHTTSWHWQVQSPSNAVIDPYILVQSEMETLCDSIREELCVETGDLGPIVRYYFDGTGKAFRPMVVMLMAKALNAHHRAEHILLESQRRLAMVTEMLHTATLIHDDVIDASDARRGKPSINSTWGQRKAILSGNYILSVMSSILARIGDPHVVSIMSQVVEDLVRGEFMQLGSKENENERFTHYLDKTFKKTSSLIAGSCQSVAVLGGCEQDLSDLAYNFGRNLGIAFQLVDDLLDFISSDQQMGKPTAADLRLGLATAPVLFAAQEFPELNALIMRRFSQDGDVELARRRVAQSDGISQTRLLATKHTQEAVRLLQPLTPSPVQRALVALTETLLSRQK